MTWPTVIVAFSTAVQAFAKDTPSVSVSNAAVHAVISHTEDGISNGYLFFLDPTGDDDVVFTLLAGQPCTGGGICSTSGGMLTNSLSKTLPGPEEEDASDDTPDAPGLPPT